MSKLVKFTLHTLSPREATMKVCLLKQSCIEISKWVWLEYYSRAVRFARFNEAESSTESDYELRKRLHMINDAQRIQSIADDAYAAGEIYDDPSFRLQAFFGTAQADAGDAK